MGSPHPLQQLVEEQVKTAQVSLQLAKHRYNLGLGISEAEYDYKIAEVMLAYSARGRTSWRSIRRCASRPQSYRTLKSPSSKAAADESTGGVASGLR